MEDMVLKIWVSHHLPEDGPSPLISTVSVQLMTHGTSQSQGTPYSSHIPYCLTPKTESILDPN